MKVMAHKQPALIKQVFYKQGYFRKGDPKGLE